MASNDPLEGYRAVNRSPDEQVEDEIRALHRIADEGIDPELVSDVLQSDQLIAAMKNDKVLGRLVTYVTCKLDECSKVWSTQADPTSRAALNAHREARAARTLIDWIEFILNRGDSSAAQMEADENYDQQT